MSNLADRLRMAKGLAEENNRHLVAFEMHPEFFEALRTELNPWLQFSTALAEVSLFGVPIRVDGRVPVRSCHLVFRVHRSGRARETFGESLYLPRPVEGR